MRRLAVVASGSVVVCLALILAPLSVLAAGSSNCGTATDCAAPFDESVSGDNQGGDAGADREPPEDNKKS